MSYILDFLGTNCIHIIITVCTIIMLQRDKTFKNNIKISFFILLVLNFIYTTVSYIDDSIKNSIYSSDIMPVMTSIRTITTAIGYVAKTLTLVIMIFTIFKPSRKSHCFLGIPAVFCCIISIASIWTGWIFSIEDNTYQSGPLKPLFIAIVYCYFAVMFAFAALRWKKNTTNQNVAIIGIILICATTSTLCLTDKYSFDFLSLGISISVLFYFLLQFIDNSNQLLESKSQIIEKQQTDLMLSQIQPHFVYNTLSIACGLCREDPALAEKTLLDFSYYLRDSLDYGGETNSITTIEKEIEHTKLYTNIEQLRFSNLSVEYNINDGGYSIPFLTVQPMVENAIRHGVRGLDGGYVKIILTRETGFHKIVIKDNGTGKSIQSQHFDKHKGIGINNVKNRLKALCGGHLTIDFTPNGTTVEILIPE